MPYYLYLKAKLPDGEYCSRAGCICPLRIHVDVEAYCIAFRLRLQEFNDGGGFNLLKCDKFVRREEQLQM
jgi:hypothetical protein